MNCSSRSCPVCRAPSIPGSTLMRWSASARPSARITMSPAGWDCTRPTSYGSHEGSGTRDKGQGTGDKEMALSGITGYVNVGTPPGVLYAFNKWKLSFKTNLPNTSSFQSAGYDDLVKGRTMATLTLSGSYNGTMPFTAGNLYEFHLGFASSPTLELVVSARVSEVSPANDYEDRPTLDVTAESTGVFTAAVV